jgi:Ca2+-transporting ATPase
MAVTSIWTETAEFEVSGEGFAPAGAFLVEGISVRPDEHPNLVLALKIAVAANRADAVLTEGRWVARGDPTEAALIVAARKAGLERAALLADFPETGEVPFSSGRQLMATFHRPPGAGIVACVKGAPQRVIALCTRAQLKGRDAPLDEARRERLLAANRMLAGRGLRVLAVASGSVTRAEESALSGLTFAGLIGMFDPPAPGVADAIRAFRAAGIRTVMITGDQRGTARAIARDLGLDSGDLSLDGRDMGRMTDAQLQADLDRVSVFTRVSPEEKLRLIAAYQARGDIVAMIGDGVNDAAALKKADVGVTMGRRGTDVARQTAAVVLEDDRFETIGAAIEEGRAVFDNISKFVFYLFSCNLAEIIMILGTTAAGSPLPLHPIQILWLNLVTDTAPALALALEPAEPGLMRRPPRNPGEGLVGPESIRKVAAYGLLIAAPALALNIWNEATGVPAGRAMTMNFLVLAFAQLFHLGNARSDRHVLAPARAVANQAALAAVALVLLAQALAVTFDPLARALHVEALGAHDWVLVAVVSLLPAVIGQLVKVGRKPRHPGPDFEKPCP